MGQSQGQLGSRVLLRRGQSSLFRTCRLGGLCLSLFPRVTFLVGACIPQSRLAGNLTAGNPAWVLQKEDQRAWEVQLEGWQTEQKWQTSAVFSVPWQAASERPFTAQVWAAPSLHSVSRALLKLLPEQFLVLCFCSYRSLCLQHLPMPLSKSQMSLRPSRLCFPCLPGQVSPFSAF